MLPFAIHLKIKKKDRQGWLSSEEESLRRPPPHAARTPDVVSTHGIEQRGKQSPGRLRVT
jgi:hypothetical protein